MKRKGVLCIIEPKISADNDMDHCDSQVLNRFVGGRLDGDEVRACEAHLAHCDGCRKRIAVLLRILQPELLPEEIQTLDITEERLREHNPGFPGRTGLLSRRSWAFFSGWRLAMSMAAVLTAAGIGLLSMRLERSSDPAWPERTFEARVSGQPYSQLLRTRARFGSGDSQSQDERTDNLTGSSFEVGRWYLREGSFVRAVERLLLAEKEHPDSAEVHNDLGVAYLESGGEGSLEKALGEFEEALQRNPKYEPALFNLALVYERLGQFPQAEQHLKLYLQLDSTSGWADEARAKLQVFSR